MSQSDSAQAQLPPHSPYPSTEHRENAMRLGIWVFLGSETFLFAALFGLFYGYRAHYLDAFNQAIQHNLLWLGTTNTFLLLLSSFFVAFSINLYHRKQFTLTRVSFALAVLLGLAFLGLKVYEYVEHGHKGILPGALYAFEELPQHGVRLFFNLYWVMTLLHALHLIGGASWLVWLIVRLGAKRAERYATAVESAGLYWHLIDVIWVFLWPMLYLQS